MDTTIPADNVPEGQFLIPATGSLHELRPRTLKHGDTFAVFDHNGDAIGAPGSTDGIYHRDTRYLSHLFLTIDGQRPILLSSTVRDDNAMLTCDLTNPDLNDAAGKLSLGHDLIHIRRSRFLYNSGCYERMALRNVHDAPRHIRIDLAFAADFADLFEVRGTARKRHGEHHAPEITADCVTLGYMGLDARERRLKLRFGPAPTALTGRKATFELDLAPGETQRIFMEMHCDPAEAKQPADRASTRVPAAACPTSICWSPTRPRGPIHMPAFRGSAPCSGAMR
jgi:glycogen debranching enzyme